MTLKIHSTEAERLAEYRICQERGHVRAWHMVERKSDDMIITQELDYVCKMCGTHYWIEEIMHESNKPEGAE